MNKCKLNFFQLLIPYLDRVWFTNSWAEVNEVLVCFAEVKIGCFQTPPLPRFDFGEISAEVDFGDFR